jgi:two-component system, LytTR family, response regulator
MDKIKYLIVEDEEKSRETLLKKIQLCNLNDIICTGMAATASEALMLAKLTPPDFVLLDINLPGKNGFELLSELQREGISPEIIFTSAHTENDILLKALKKFPSSYLVKPIDMDELETAIKNVCILVLNKNSLHIVVYSKIKLNSYHGPIYLNPEQILMIKAEANHSKLFLDNGDTLQLNQSIATIERDSNLNEPTFYRADRSTILNLNYVEQFYPKKGECTLHCGNVVVIAELSQNGLKKLIEKIETRIEN